MVNPFKAITISIIPNFRSEDIYRVLGWYLNKKQWTTFELNNELKKRLSEMTQKENVYLYDSGRTALREFFKCIKGGQRNEVVIQGFTCSVVPAAIMAANKRPIYVDIDESLNIDPKKLKEKISQKTLAVIVQHTFGEAAKIEEIKKMCLENEVILIEDMAHGLGYSFKGKHLGSFGDVALFSFGRDKSISGVWGGGVAFNNLKWKRLMEKSGQELPRLQEEWVRKQLRYILISWMVVNTYNLFGLGKLMHFIFKKLSWLSEPITRKEKEGGVEAGFLGIPDPLANLVLEQLRRSQLMISHRQKMVDIYSKNLGSLASKNKGSLRWSLMVDDPDGLRVKAAKKSIFLGDWYDQLVAPHSVDPMKFGYRWGDCPRAEWYAKRVVNLPTNYNLELVEAQKLVKLVKEWNLKK